MKTIAKHFILFLSVLFIATSCSNNDDDANNSSNIDIDNQEVKKSANIAPQAVKFEVTGNFSGSLFATCTLPDNSNVLQDEEGVLTLPWTKEFTTARGTEAAAILTGGIGGAAGEKITVKIYVNGVVKEEITTVANSAGKIISGRRHEF